MDKVLMIVAAGIADRPVAELDERTPLQAARTPALDRLAAEGESGAWRAAEGGDTPGAEAAVCALLGYGGSLPPGVLEASGAGAELREGEAAFRASFVCLRPGPTSVVMFDPNGAGLTEEEGQGLVRYLNEHMALDPGEEVRLLPTRGNRAAFLYRREGEAVPRAALEGFASPHAIQGQPIGEHMPVRAEARRFVHFVNDSQMILSAHPGLRERAQSTMFAANSLWLWGGGVCASVPAVGGVTGGRRVALVAEDPALAGMARLAGAAHIDPGGDPAAAARRAMAEADIVLLVADAGEEASVRGDLDAKIGAIERFDAEVIEPLLRDPGAERCRVLVAADAVTPVEAPGRPEEPVPYALAACEAGRLQPPAPEGGLSGLWRRLTGGAGGRTGAPAFHEFLGEGGSTDAGALRRRLLAA